MFLTRKRMPERNLFLVGSQGKTEPQDSPCGGNPERIVRNHNLKCHKFLPKIFDWPWVDEDLQRCIILNRWRWSIVKQ